MGALVQAGRTPSDGCHDDVVVVFLKRKFDSTLTRDVFRVSEWYRKAVLNAAVNAQNDMQKDEETSNVWEDRGQPLLINVITFDSNHWNEFQGRVVYLKRADLVDEHTDGKTIVVSELQGKNVTGLRVV